MKLTEKQKANLPKALQKAILAKHKGKKAPMKKVAMKKAPMKKVAMKKAPKKKATHKMPDGTIMTGAKHNKNSKAVKYK